MTERQKLKGRSHVSICKDKTTMKPNILYIYADTPIKGTATSMSVSKFGRQF
jgi:hypothetical protein